MPRWPPRLLRRIHELAALDAGLDPQDACDVLASLTADDFAKRLESEHNGEWMYVFKPSVASTVVYLKLLLRADCLVVSFHEDEGELQ